MKKQNKRKVASLVLCSALLAGFVLSPAAASAETTTIEGTGSKVGNLVNGDLKNNPVTIPIKASTSGSDIVYNIDVTPGAMTFQYSYGKTWVPSTHSYSEGSTTGWNAANFDEDKAEELIKNNEIRVNNKSNYPIVASFKVEDTGALKDKFNAKDEGGNYPSNAVVGVFSANNSDFIANGVVKVNDNPASFHDKADLTLEMNASDASVTTYYRVKNSVAKNDQTKCVGRMFFALAGKPTKTVEESKEVGNIVVTIAPPTDGVTEVVPSP